MVLGVPSRYKRSGMAAGVGFGLLAGALVMVYLDWLHSPWFLRALLTKEVRQFKASIEARRAQARVQQKTGVGWHVGSKALTVSARKQGFEAKGPGHDGRTATWAPMAG